MKKQPARKVIGSFEPVSFPRFGVNNTMAKIDTGAYTGALHCTKIRLEDDKLHFSPFDHPEIEVVAETFFQRTVTSSNGKRQKRYFIQTHIVIRGTEYPITLSLADRSEMRWPVLIGRRFLRQNRFLVDVSQGIEYLERMRTKGHIL